MFLQVNSSEIINAILAIYSNYNIKFPEYPLSSIDDHNGIPTGMQCGVFRLLCMPSSKTKTYRHVELTEQHSALAKTRHRLNNMPHMPQRATD